MSARDNILGKLRSARGPVTASPVPEVRAWYGNPPVAERAQLIAQMRANLEAAHAEVIVATPDAWPGQLALRLAGGGVKRLLMNPGTPEAAQLAIALKGIEVLAFDRPIEAWKRELFDQVDAGFTVVDGAVAETGALVIRSGPTMPRTVSLVPPIHVALVRAASIQPRLIDAAVAGAWAQHLPTNLVTISGPSKTADIQQTTAYGAHGPRELIVVVVTEELQ